MINEEYMYHLVPETTTLVKIGLRTLEKFSFDINLPRAVGLKPIFCQYSLTKVFIYSGTTTSHHDSYVLNLFTLEVEVKEPSQVRYSAAGVHYDNKIYLFGGHNGERNLDSSLYFDLLLNTWIDIGALPNPSSCTSACLFSSQIPISGYHLDLLYVYTPALNNYMAIDIDLSLGSHKVVCSDLTKVFIIEINRVKITSDFINFECVQQFRSVLPTKWALVTNPKLYENFIYFIYNDFILRRLDCLNGKVEAISNV